jgi:hypothetical protein
MSAVTNRFAKPSDSRHRTQCKLARLGLQARAFPYSVSKRLHAFSACGSL